MSKEAKILLSTLCAAKYSPLPLAIIIAGITLRPSVLNLPELCSCWSCRSSKSTEVFHPPSSSFSQPGSGLFQAAFLLWATTAHSCHSSAVHTHVQGPPEVLLAADAPFACPLPGRGLSRLSSQVHLSCVTSSCCAPPRKAATAYPLVCLLPEDLKRHCRFFPAMGDSRQRNSDAIIATIDLVN